MDLVMVMALVSVMDMEPQGDILHNVKPLLLLEVLRGPKLYLHLLQ